VYLYEGNSTSGATLAHGLGTAPGFVLVKSIAAGNDWYVQHSSINPNEFLRLNTTIAATADTSIWNNVAASSTLVTLGNAGELNSTSYNYIMYVFSPKKGFSKFETFDGNGNANGPFIYTGFRPSMMFIKKAGGTGDWMLFDDKRLGYNPDNNALNPNLTDAAGTTDYLDILSNGFKLRTSDALVNGSATQYVYAAFAEFPIVSSNDVPVVAR
jgi:hypothetical protein